MRVKSGNRGNSANKRNGSSQKDAGTRPGPPKSKALVPEWNSLHSDLSAHKLSDAELLKRKAERTSKNHLAAKTDWRDKIEKLANGEQVEPPKNASTSRIDRTQTARGPAFGQKSHTSAVKDRNNSRERSREANGRVQTKLTGDKLISHIDESLAKTKQLLEAIEKGDISTAMTIHASPSGATKGGPPKANPPKKDLDSSQSSKLSRSTVNDDTLHKADKLNEEIRALLKKYAPQEEIDQPIKSSKYLSNYEGGQDGVRPGDEMFGYAGLGADDPLKSWGYSPKEDLPLGRRNFSEALSDTDKEEFGLKKLDDLLQRGDYGVKSQGGIEYQDYEPLKMIHDPYQAWHSAFIPDNKKETNLQAPFKDDLEPDHDLKFEPLDGIFGEAKAFDYLRPSGFHQDSRQDEYASFKPKIDNNIPSKLHEVSDPFAAIDSSAILKPEQIGGIGVDASRFDALSQFLGKPTPDEDGDTSKEMSLLLEDDEYMRKLKGILESTHDDMKQMDTAWEPKPSKIPPNNIKLLTKATAAPRISSAAPVEPKTSKQTHNKAMQNRAANQPKLAPSPSKAASNPKNIVFSNKGEDMDEFERLEAEVQHDIIPRRNDGVPQLPMVLSGGHDDSDEGIAVRPSKPVQGSVSRHQKQIGETQALFTSDYQATPSTNSTGITSYYSMIPRKLGTATLTQPGSTKNPSKQSDELTSFTKHPTADQSRPQAPPQMAYWASDKPQTGAFIKPSNSASFRPQSDRDDDEDDDLCLKKQIKGTKKQFGQ